MPQFVLASAAASPNIAGVNRDASTGAAAPFDPAQLRTAYGVNLISFNGTAGTGAGQTIAIVDAYNDPTILSDANSFSSEFGLQQFNVSGGPTLSVLNQNGGTSLPANASVGTWDIEEALDVEWAHAIAPNANIILYEANSNAYSDLFQAIATARSNPNVSTVSMSWGGGEFSSETGYDSYFTTPSGHQGITFLAATGDNGTPASYPALSPNVVAVGGTSLSIGSSGSYISETPWDDSYGADGGGISVYESQPGYQVGKVNGTSSTNRTVPDVSMDADVNSGVYVLDSYAGGYYQVGGTSLATPMWAGLVAVADQGRALSGLSSLDGATQTLPALYSLPASDFHDITTGSNGTYPATVGYDLATGIGSPVANLLVPGLAAFDSNQTNQPPAISAPGSGSLSENGSLTFSSANGNAISVADAAVGAGSDSLSLSVNSGTLSLASINGLTVTSGASGTNSVTVSGTLANLNAALNGLIYTPTAGSSGTDSLKISITDSGDSLTASASVALSINALSAPTIKVPATASVIENSVLVFSAANGNAFTIVDANAGNSADTLTINATNGTFTLGSTVGISITSGSNGSGAMTLTGSVANLNTAINGLTYTPIAGFSGSGSLKMSVNDPVTNLNGSSTLGITINPLNQPPSVDSPQTAAVSENASVVFSASNGNEITVADSDAGTNAERLTLTATHGTLRLATTAGLTFVSGSNRSASMTVSGTIANLNTALNGLTFTPTSRFVGTASIGVSIQDVGDNMTASKSITVTVSKPGRATRTNSHDVHSSDAHEILSKPSSVELDPLGASQTILVVSGDNGTTNLVGSEKTTIGVTAGGVSQPLLVINGPHFVSGARSDDVVGVGATVSTAADFADGSADEAQATENAADIWAGLVAALEMLG